MLGYFIIIIILFQLQANSIHLRYVMSFLPVARSSATLDYFHTLNTKESKTLGDR